MPPARDPVRPAATARAHRSPVPFRRVPAARAHRSPAAIAQRSQLRRTASLRSVALVGSVKPCRSRRRPAPRRIGPRRGQPVRHEHPRDRRRIVDRRQHTPWARALRTDQHVDAERAPQQIAQRTSAGQRAISRRGAASDRASTRVRAARRDRSPRLARAASPRAACWSLAPAAGTRRSRRHR